MGSAVTARPEDRTCYQIASHRSPEQVYRLVETLAASSDAPLIVVDHDRRGPELDARRLARSDARLLLSDAGYADWSHTARYLEVVDELERAGEPYAWMVNLSGQDYPVRPVAETEAELRDSGADGFLECFDVLSGDSPWGVARGRSRYWYRYRRFGHLSERAKARLRPVQAVNRVQPWVRVQVASGAAVGRRVASPFGAQLTCYGGSFFMSVNRAAVEELQRFTRDRPDVVEHYRRTLSPAESYFQTALRSSGRLRFDGDCKRYFDFRGSQLNHPRTLDETDVARARDAGAHFARKWDLARDPGAFELMDSLISGQPA